MKYCNSILFLFFIFVLQVLGKSSGNNVRIVCGAIGYEIQVEFLEQKKEFPNSWENLNCISSIREGRLKPDIGFMEIANRFALVPQKPLINKDMTVPFKYDGKRLLLIGRKPEIDSISKFSGRYVIFLSSQKTTPEKLFIETDFIPEDVAQGILAQMPDFDPVRQPLAFDLASVREIERSKKVSMDELKESVRDWDVRAEKRGRDEDAIATDERKSRDSQWLILGVPIIALLAWLAYRMFGRRQNGKER